jgi:hypothetical protein
MTILTYIGLGSIVDTSRGKMIVHKVNPKNYICYDEAGNGWNIRRVSARLAQSDTFNRAAYDAFLNKQRDLHSDRLRGALETELVLGSVVRFTDAATAIKWPGEYVVISSPTSSGRVKVAKLGGDADRYVTAPTEMVKLAEFSIVS